MEKVLIVGVGDSGLSAAQIAEVKASLPKAEVMTINEMREKDLVQSFVIEAPPLQMDFVMDTPFIPGPSARNLRRKEARKKKRR